VDEEKTNTSEMNEEEMGTPQHLFQLSIEEFKTNWESSVKKFDDLGLKEEVLRGVYGYGFVKPSPIQQVGILPVI